jgi:hypothetical protein
MIKIRHGFSFSGVIISVGIAFSLFGFLMLFEVWLIGLVLLAIGLFFSTSAYGIQIDVVESKFREYGSIIGIKYGKWQDLIQMPYLSIMSSRAGLRVYSRSNKSVSLASDQFNINLLSENHRKRVKVISFDNMDDAQIYGEELSGTLHTGIVKFNPPISEKTLNRRKKR